MFNRPECRRVRGNSSWCYDSCSATEGGFSGLHPVHCLSVIVIQALRHLQPFVVHGGGIYLCACMCALSGAMSPCLLFCFSAGPASFAGVGVGLALQVWSRKVQQSSCGLMHSIASVLVDDSPVFKHRVRHIISARVVVGPAGSSIASCLHGRPICVYSSKLLGSGCVQRGSGCGAVQTATSTREVLEVAAEACATIVQRPNVMGLQV